jgi:hypothetical protein
MEGVTGVTVQKIALKMMYNDIMKRGNPKITDDFKEIGHVILIFRARFEMPKHQIILVDTHIANRKNDRALFETKNGRYHMLQTLPHKLRQSIYHQIMKNGSPEITKDLGVITFFCELYPDGDMTNSYTTISNNDKTKNEPIKISFAKRKPQK